MIAVDKVRLNARLTDIQRSDLSITKRILSQAIILDNQGTLIARKHIYLAQKARHLKVLPALLLDIKALAQQLFILDSAHTSFTLSERLMIGADLEMRIGSRQGLRQDLWHDDGCEPTDKNKKMISLLQNYAEVISLKGVKDTRRHIASCIGLNHESFRQGKLILRQGIPALIAAIDQKQLPLYKAVRLAKLPQAMQQQELAYILPSNFKHTGEK